MGSESHYDADPAVYGDRNVASRLCLHYANGMTRQALLALILVPGMAHAVICKTVDSEGVVSYADVPAAECRQPVKLPASSTYQPRQLPDSVRPTHGTTKAAGKEKFRGYRSIEILQPESNGTVRNNEGKVQVVLGFEPEFQAGHRIKLFLDGGAVPGEFDGTSIQLSGVNRGTHNLRAVISDAEGKRLGDSPTIRFTLRQPGLFDNALPDKNPPKPENPIEPGPDDPKPENPIAPVPTPLPSNPGNGGIPSTPGQTNPAFKPNYGAK